jgi:hypothetical protein
MCTLSKEVSRFQEALVILISDNEVMNSLYEVNLRACVATNVTIKQTLDSATRLLGIFFQVLMK